MVLTEHHRPVTHLSLYQRHRANCGGAYNSIIESGAVHIVSGQWKCAVFPVAHPAGMGAMNRNKGKKYNDVLDIMKQDWSRIGDHLREQGIRL